MGERGAPDLTFTIRHEESVQRIDLFLSRQCSSVSRSQFKKLIQDNMVLLNGLPVRPGYEVRPGDRISVWIPAPASKDQLSPQPMLLDILHEDEDIIVINKAPGMVVHPGAGHYDGTLVHGLLAHCPKLASQGAPLRPGIVHRLDMNTSGALVIAKSEQAYLDLIRQFKVHSVRKEYLALAYGRMPEENGEIRFYLDRHPLDRKRMAVVERRGREAVSRWHVEKDWSEISLLRVIIETGRTHQIRVHLSHIQHPVVGDATYGGGPRRAKGIKSRSLQTLLLRVDRQMLHAWRLGFMHPATGSPIQFKAPLPPDFARLIDEIQEAFFNHAQ
ncbi:MAG: RluA family pseudouridine synthase [Syntrophobacteraceae bacterium]